jgi:hypothetical protein
MESEIVVSTLPTEEDRETFWEMLYLLSGWGLCDPEFHKLGAKLFNDESFTDDMEGLHGKCHIQ